MRSNAVSTHKFFLLCLAFCGAILVSSQDAKALTIGDFHELGFLWPGIQKKTDNQNKALYVNHLIGMALGTIEVARGEVYFRSSHGFRSLPAAAWAHDGGGRAINLGTGGLYTYLFATYSGYGTEIWYVGKLNGINKHSFSSLPAPPHRLDPFCRGQYRGPGRWHYGNVTRCGSRCVGFGAAFPNALALTLIEELHKILRFGAPI